MAAASRSLATALWGARSRAACYRRPTPPPGTRPRTLGVEALAEALVAHAAVDPILRKKLGMMLAAARGAGTLGDEIDKRLRTIARSRAFVEWDKQKALALELDHLRATIATRLAESDRARAVDLLWDFIAMADAVLQRIGDRIGEMEQIFDAAMADLGRLSVASPPQDRRALARRVLAYCDRDSFGGTDALISHMSEALGAEGRAEIRKATETALRTAPPATGGAGLARRRQAPALRVPSGAARRSRTRPRRLHRVHSRRRFGGDARARCRRAPARRRAASRGAGLARQTAAARRDRRQRRDAIFASPRSRRSAASRRRRPRAGGISSAR